MERPNRVSKVDKECFRTQAAHGSNTSRDTTTQVGTFCWSGTYRGLFSCNTAKYFCSGVTVIYSVAKHRSTDVGWRAMKAGTSELERKSFLFTLNDWWSKQMTMITSSSTHSCYVSDNYWLWGRTAKFYVCSPSWGSDLLCLCIYD